MVRLEQLETHIIQKSGEFQAVLFSKLGMFNRITGYLCARLVYGQANALHVRVLA